ncbi:hypothetical protein PoB_004758200 [Plakobranchus ocellatus]|uniref:Uncharacterized protein n=1 Tax=Plakobranchus ocellatus TaxID=259542 RepID=A0AAV4BQ35_9GAST|nr:hypothetical protein PoB_004758200 [Plakobranchus ocellatus]
MFIERQDMAYRNNLWSGKQIHDLVFVHNKVTSNFRHFVMPGTRNQARTGDNRVPADLRAIHCATNAPLIRAPINFQMKGDTRPVVK